MNKIDYLVSIENTPYYHWQIDLLIKSFQYLNMEDQLVIFIAEHTPEIKVNSYGNLLYKHKRIYKHSNMGQANKLVSIISGLENKLISQPFISLHPDMVLHSPISFKENVYFDTYSYWDRDKWQLIEERIDVPNRDIAPENMRMGDIYCFNNLPMDFFYYWYQENGKTKNYVFSQEKDSLILSLYKFLPSGISCRGEVLQSHLLDEEIKPVIHYKHGLPPDFNKWGYKNMGFGMSTSDPYQIILENNTTPAMSYLNLLLAN